jgi:hypothetical protein
MMTLENVWGLTRNESETEATQSNHENHFNASERDFEDKHCLKSFHALKNTQQIQFSL